MTGRQNGRPGDSEAKFEFENRIVNHVHGNKEAGQLDKKKQSCVLLQCAACNLPVMRGYRELCLLGNQTPTQAPKSDSTRLDGTVHMARVRNGKSTYHELGHESVPRIIPTNLILQL